MVTAVALINIYRVWNTGADPIIQLFTFHTAEAQADSYDKKKGKSLRVAVIRKTLGNLLQCPDALCYMILSENQVP